MIADADVEADNDVVLAVVDVVVVQLENQDRADDLLGEEGAPSFLELL